MPGHTALYGNVSVPKAQEWPVIGHPTQTVPATADLITVTRSSAANRLTPALDAERERLANEAKELAREQSALASDDVAGLEAHLSRMRAHIAALNAYLAAVSPPQK
jgi:hypothetical protein